MSTRVVDIERPYEWGTAIEVTQDKVINLRLRSENNLIIYDEWDNEIYVDLQLPSDIEPADAIPVWINTGRVLAADWWDYTGTIVVFKTTSWDNIKLLYADNGRVFIDNWTGTFKEIYLKWDVDALIWGLRGYIDDELAKKQDKLTAWANITIQEDPQTHELVISSTWWGASYTAWTGIDIDANDVISVDSTYMSWYIPRSSGIYPDNLIDSVIYYWKYTNQWVTTALWLASDQVTVRADIDQQNKNRGYLEYYNWAVDLFLSDTVSGANTTAMYKSTGIESTAGWTTETFEFQWTWNNKIARLSDLSSYIKTWSNAVSSSTSGVELRHTTDSNNYEYVKVAPSRISASVCVNWAVTQYFYHLTWTSNNRIARITDINSAVSVVSWDSNTYSIVVSNSAPASWTPNTTLTFVV